MNVDTGADTPPPSPSNGITHHHRKHAAERLVAAFGSLRSIFRSGSEYPPCDRLDPIADSLREWKQQKETDLLALAATLDDASNLIGAGPHPYHFGHNAFLNALSAAREVICSVAERLPERLSNGDYLSATLCEQLLERLGTLDEFEQLRHDVQRELLAIRGKSNTTHTTPQGHVPALDKVAIALSGSTQTSGGAVDQQPAAVATKQPPTAKKPRDPDQPSNDRVSDIRAAIVHKGTPLTRPEIVKAMGLKQEGALGRHLAWMVRNKILVNLPPHGYWPASLPIPE